MQLQNAVLKESGQMLLSSAEKVRHRVKTPAESDPSAQRGVTAWCRVVQMI